MSNEAQAVRAQIEAALAAGPTPGAQAEPIERQYVSPVNTIADLVNNLLILDQALPIYGAQYIDHPTRGRCAIAVDPTVSRERVLDSRWIGQGDALNAAVIWTRASQISPAEPIKDADSRDAVAGEIRSCREADGRCGMCGGDWSVCGCQGMLTRAALQAKEATP